MSDDFSGVTAALDAPAGGYKPKDVMTATISGSDVVTSVEQLEVDLTLRNPLTGATSGPLRVTAPITTVQPESVVIASATDGTGRVWTVAPNGLSVSAVA